MPGFGTWSKSIIFMVKTFAVYTTKTHEKKAHRFKGISIFGHCFLVKILTEIFEKIAVVYFSDKIPMKFLRKN